ncbi:hypothetical protein D3C73_1574080 [compost metagenome]
MTNDRLSSMAPAKKSQKLTAFRRGKATSRAPIWSGITTFMSPKMKGIAMNRIMMRPWVVKTSL